jgi:hypothetical protein
MGMISGLAPPLHTTRVRQFSIKKDAVVVNLYLKVGDFVVVAQ